MHFCDSDTALSIACPVYPEYRPCAPAAQPFLREPQCPASTPVRSRRLCVTLLLFPTFNLHTFHPQFILAQGMGFWPAAFLLSFLFGMIHYFTKPYERWPDWASTGLLALLICLTLRRTGDLRFAVGFHAAFDFGAIFVYSGPNGGQFAPDRLLNATFHGSDWLTGGKLGPEASLLVFPVIAAMFLAFHLYRGPGKRQADPKVAT